MNNDSEKYTQVSIKEIAREAGVSIATVSNVINKSYKVKEKTIKRVEEVIRKYNYRVNIGASSLRGKSSKLIGVIVPELSNPFFSKLNDEIERYASQFGYSIAMCNNNYEYEKDIEHIEILIARNVDGLIMVPSFENKKVVEPAINSNIPVVLINRKIKDCSCDAVLVDAYSAIVASVEYLVSLGHKKILYMNAEPELFISRMRLKGYKDALKKHGLSLNKDFIIKADGFTYADGYNFLKKLQDLKDKPTAILAYNDMLAIGLLKAFSAAGFKIPQDYSVMGFDNIIIDEYLEVGLTSVAIGLKAIAQRAVDILLEKIKNKKIATREIFLPINIIKRDSVGIAG
jgi:DNA-binding LacI/PurR family transcriptional regulator